jgi:hypothetical protein
MFGGFPGHKAGKRLFIEGEYIVSDQNSNQNPKMLVQISFAYIMLIVSLLVSVCYIFGPSDLRIYHFAAGEIAVFTATTLAMRWWAVHLSRDLYLAIIMFAIGTFHFVTVTWRLQP